MNSLYDKKCANLHCSGMMSATASLGMSLLWDTDVGLSHVDKYTYSSEEHIKVRFPPVLRPFRIVPEKSLVGGFVSYGYFKLQCSNRRGCCIGSIGRIRWQ